MSRDDLYRPTPRARAVGADTRSRLTRLLGVLCVLCGSVVSPAGAQTADDPRLRQAELLWRTGKYDQATNAYRELSGRANAAPEAMRGYVRVLAEVGKYDEAEAAARRFAAGARGAEAANVLGEVLATRGKVAEAAEAFARAVSGGASDSLVALLNGAVLRHERGEIDAARPIFERFIGIYNQRAARLSSEELAAVAVAVRYLGRNDPQLFKDALKAFDEAVATDSMNLDARVRLGELFLEKIQSPDAAETFDAVLKVNPAHPRALLGQARRLSFDGAPGAMEMARKALATNPNLAEARVFVARLHVDAEEVARADSELVRALAVDPGAVDALAILAASRYVGGDSAAFEDARRRALARNPRAAEFYATLSEQAARNRLYRQAARFAAEGVRLDSAYWRAHGLLGINQLRLGQVDEARRSLEAAFKGDPYDVWIKNTLDLLDTFKDYTVTQTPRFRLMVETKESDLMSLYLGELMEEAYTKLSERYGYRPETPVRIELYRSHADFSVRTVGLAGIGALGVAFGNVLAMDSPAARDNGDFNWGSVAWHELAHTFTLGMTNHRVPRWLSEGISVYEERRARPTMGWGADPSAGFLSAFAAGKLVPVSRMNDGFMRPAYPEQVIFSYYQASLVCELIERDHGARALVEMLHGYRDGLTTPQVFERVLKTTPEAFDKKFDAYVRQRFEKALAGIGQMGPAFGGGRGGEPAVGVVRPTSPESFLGQLTQAKALLEQGKKEEAIPFLQRAAALFPEYTGADAPNLLLAAIHKDAGRARQAADALAKVTALDENDLKANLAQADLLAQLGDTAGAAAALERAVWISPYDAALHARLAGFYTRLGDKAKVVRERRAVLALDPVDKADARYRVALAYHEAGDAANARRYVLRALEEAPMFQPAQELLLTLHASQGRRP